MKTLLCYCGASLEISEEDLGFEEYECPRCCQSVPVPDNFCDFDDHNEAILAQIEKSRFTGKVRIMATQETGEEKCYRLLPEDDMELINLVMAGYGLIYPECKFYTEREENLIHAVNQQLLDRGGY